MKEILSRIHSLVVKLISVKGMIFFVATWLLATDHIDGTTWWLSAAVVIGGRAYEKAMSK